jgi:hypothetical protein
MLPLARFGGNMPDLRALNKLIKKTGVSVNPPSIATVATGTVDVAVTGASVGDIVLVTPRADFNDDLIIKGAFVQAANNVRLMLYNPTGGAIDAGAQTVDIFVLA